MVLPITCGGKVGGVGALHLQRGLAWLDNAAQELQDSPGGDFAGCLAATFAGAASCAAPDLALRKHRVRPVDVTCAGDLNALLQKLNGELWERSAVCLSLDEPPPAEAADRYLRLGVSAAVRRPADAALLGSQPRFQTHQGYAVDWTDKPNGCSGHGGNPSSAPGLASPLQFTWQADQQQVKLQEVRHRLRQPRTGARFPLGLSWNLHAGSACCQC